MGETKDPLRLKTVCRWTQVAVHDLRPSASNGKRDRVGELNECFGLTCGFPTGWFIELHLRVPLLGETHAGVMELFLEGAASRLQLVLK